MHSPQTEYYSLTFRRATLTFPQFSLACLISIPPHSLQRVLHLILAIRAVLHIREVKADNSSTDMVGLTVPTFPGLVHKEMDSEEELELGERHASTPGVIAEDHNVVESSSVQSRTERMPP